MTKDGTVQTIRAEKEVILSAGAVNSPQLLLLSGVGPKHDLEKLKVFEILSLSFYEADMILFAITNFPVLILFLSITISTKHVFFTIS